MPSRPAWPYATSGARAWTCSRSSTRTAQISEDEHHKNSAKVQELTDRLIKEIDQVLVGKEAEIKQV